MRSVAVAQVIGVMLLGACTGFGIDATPPSLPVVRIDIVAVPEGPGMTTYTGSELHARFAAIKLFLSDSPQILNRLPGINLPCIGGGEPGSWSISLTTTDTVSRDSGRVNVPTRAVCIASAPGHDLDGPQAPSR